MLFASCYQSMLRINKSQKQNRGDIICMIFICKVILLRQSGLLLIKKQRFFICMNVVMQSSSRALLLQKKMDLIVSYMAKIVCMHLC